MHEVHIETGYTYSRQLLYIPAEYKGCTENCTMQFSDHHSYFRQNSRFFEWYKIAKYSKTYVKRLLSKRPQIGFQAQLSLNAGQKYCRMRQGEHFAILLSIIKLPFVIKIFVLSIFGWSFTQVLLYSL